MSTSFALADHQLHTPHPSTRSPPPPPSPQGVIKLGAERAESKCTLVYGQMNEPPGARARVALTGLTVAEYFRDVEGQDVLLFVDNIFRFTQVGGGGGRACVWARGRGGLCRGKTTRGCTTQPHPTRSGQRVSESGVHMASDM
jgi:hypothetical protein